MWDPLYETQIAMADFVIHGNIGVYQCRLYCVYTGLLHVTESHFNICLVQDVLKINMKFNGSPGRETLNGSHLS